MVTTKAHYSDKAIPVCVQATCIKSIKQYDPNTIWRPVEKSLVMKLCTVGNEDRWSVQTHLKGGKVLRESLQYLQKPPFVALTDGSCFSCRTESLTLTHPIALTSLHGFAWRGRRYHYECFHALMALPLRHAGSLIGHFQRMVKNRS